MKTRCPGCETHYQIDAEALLDANGIARCLRCGTLFDALSEQSVSVLDIDEQDSSRLLKLDQSDEISQQLEEDRALPFDVPDDLETLEPSDDDALNVEDTLYEKRSYSGFFYALLALLLVVGLVAQLAWQYRLELLDRFPPLEIVCEQLPCRPTVVHEPDRYQVAQRSIKATVNEPESLTLNATIRNDAQFAQRLPDIQLSLIDNNGGVIVRRRLSPREYVFPPPPEDRLVEPGEVFTIDIDFADPGHIASGFLIDFF